MKKILLILLLTILFIPGSISANTPAPGGVSILEINGFQNIVNTGDRFYLVYYDLDLSTWCNTNVLANDDGCSDSPPFPKYPETQAGNLVLNFKDLSGNTSASSFIRRIGDSLGVVYIGAGNTIPFNDPNYQICLETISTGSKGWTMTPVCSSIIYRQASDNTLSANRNELRNYILANVYSIEQNVNLQTGTLISNSGVITAEGQKITEVAFPGLFQIIDNLYSLSGVDVLDEFTPGSLSPLDNTMQSQTNQTSIPTDVNRASLEFLGIGGQAGMLAIIVIVGGLLSVTSYLVTGNSFVAWVGFMMLPMLSMWISVPTFSYIAVILIVLGIATGLWLVVRSPG